MALLVTVVVITIILMCNKFHLQSNPSKTVVSVTIFINKILCAVSKLNGASGQQLYSSVCIERLIKFWAQKMVYNNISTNHGHHSHKEQQ
jgi:hypothetical protein